MTSRSAVDLGQTAGHFVHWDKYSADVCDPVLEGLANVEDVGVLTGVDAAFEFLTASWGIPFFTDFTLRPIASDREFGFSAPAFSSQRSRHAKAIKGARMDSVALMRAADRNIAASPLHPPSRTIRIEP